MNPLRKPALFALALALGACSSTPRTREAPAARGTEILWDTYGVPHIYAKDRAGLAYAFGWAQMRNHSDLLLRLVAQARGRASEYLGAAYVGEDEWVWTLDLRGAAARTLQAQSTGMRAHLESFVSGINAFAAAHPELIGDSVRAILPVEPIDVLAHLNRVLYAGFISGSDRVRAETRAWRDRGSNAWAVAPKRSASGHTLLLQNPHLPWSDLYTWIETEYQTPEGMNVSGAALVLSPVLQIAFNDSLGWTHTVNTQDGEDLYELTLSGDGYLYDGAVKQFTTATHVLRVRQKDGSFRDNTVRVRSSVYGPVIADKAGKAVAVALVGLHGPPLDGGLDQWWAMGSARNFGEFVAAITPNQISGQNITYGDREGHVAMFYGGNTPIHARGDRAFWGGIVRGDSSALLWTALHPFADLPKTVDPPSGWVQNTNDPPWWATFPVVVRPGDYPPYIATRNMALRPQRSARILSGDSSITWDEFLAYKNSTRMELADRVLDELLRVATTSASAAVRQAAGILLRWDRSADSGSRGALLFTAWWGEYSRRMQVQGKRPYATPWSEDAPRTTPAGLSDTTVATAALETVVGAVTQLAGSADVAWGTVYRLRRDGRDYPANGAGGEFGVFRVLGFSRDTDGKFAANGGTSYVAAVEFANPVRAVSLIGYGNASRAGSPHRTDQLLLFANKESKPVWRTRAEVLAHLELREPLLR